jgi:hypothetical protein
MRAFLFKNKSSRFGGLAVLGQSMASYFLVKISPNPRMAGADSSPRICSSM